jgi:hypothetical protein
MLLERHNNQIDLNSEIQDLEIIMHGIKELDKKINEILETLKED